MRKLSTVADDIMVLTALKASRAFIQAFKEEYGGISACDLLLCIDEALDILQRREDAQTIDRRTSCDDVPFH